MKLEGKVAVVTGAGSGMGKAAATRFAREGAKVVLCDINLEAIENAADEIRLSGGHALAILLDVTQERSWIAAASAIKEAYGAVHIFFNNAGLLILKPLTEITIDDWNKLMAVNCTGVFLGMKHIIPLIEASGGGSVINNSSDAGLMGYVNHVLYGASKGAVTIMTRCAAAEYATRNVRINSIHPGFVDTSMVRAFTDGAELDDRYYSPQGKLVAIDQITNLLVFLASDDSDCITGAPISIDGGGTNFQVASEPFEIG